MSDPTATAEPSPEELRAYLEHLRGADAAGLLAEAYNLLAAGAQVKLGRPDARTLIDAMGAMAGAVAAAVPPELADQMRQGVGQLQLAQVSAEREAAGQVPAGASDAAGGGPAGPAGADRPAAAAPPPPTPPATDRLWIPGRDPGPRR